MKPSTILIIVLSVLFGYSLIYIYKQAHDVRYTNDRIDSLYKEAMRLKYYQSRLDSLIEEKERKIAIQDFVLQNREREAIEAKQVANEIRKKYESLKRLHFSSNAQRDSVWAALYPTGYHF